MPQYDSQRDNPYVGNLSVKIVIDERIVGIIDAQDIVECYFVEDIFSFCITGKLVFYDVYGLLEKGPFTGNEMISLVYGVKENKEIVFHIWKVKNIVQSSGVNPTAENLIEVIFVDTSFYGMTVPKYSRSFSQNERYTEVVKYILREMVGWQSPDINIEDSKNALDEAWAMPYWTCQESIKWLLKRAIGNKSNTSGYLCYNSTEETWKTNVYTLNYLFSEDNIVDRDDYIFEGGNEDSQNKIFDWWISGTDKSAMVSVRGGKWRGYISGSKELYEYDYKFSDGIKNTMLLGKKAIMPDITDIDSQQKLTGEKTKENVRNVLYDEWVKDYSLQFMVNIIVQGNEKRYCGHQIQIAWPSVDKETELYQKQLEGKYLVKSITHSFVGKGRGSINYVQRMVLMKNAYQNSNSQKLLNATKQNISGGNKEKFILEI